MCGIVGIVNYNENMVEKKELIREMANTLEKRGPDESRVCFIRTCSYWT